MIKYSPSYQECYVLQERVSSAEEVRTILHHTRSPTDRLVFVEVDDRKFNVYCVSLDLVRKFLGESKSLSLGSAHLSMEQMRQIEQAEVPVILLLEFGSMDTHDRLFLLKGPDLIVDVNETYQKHHRVALRKRKLETEISQEYLNVPMKHESYLSEFQLIKWVAQGADGNVTSVQREGKKYVMKQVFDTKMEECLTNMHLSASGLLPGCLVLPLEVFRVKDQCYLILPDLHEEGYVSLLEVSFENWDNFKRVMFHVMDCLFYLWEHGWIHGDAAPRNVFVHLETLQVKVLDFGRTERHTGYLPGLIRNVVSEFRVFLLAIPNITKEQAEQIPKQLRDVKSIQEFKQVLERVQPSFPASGPLVYRPRKRYEEELESSPEQHK